MINKRDKRSEYEIEFKIEAVRLIVEKVRSIYELAHELVGIMLWQKVFSTH